MANDARFQRTYEELKLDCNFFIVISSYSVFSVPMRNWNLRPRRRTAAVYWRFQRTYEELKHCSRRLVTGAPVVFSVPMRNWNEKKIPVMFISTTVFSVPMRNWNQTVRLSLIDRQPTFSAYLWGIETLNKWGKRCSKWCFQRTYEELKLDIAGYAECVARVFSVPMRNWNALSGRGFRPRPGFSAYLWGIETNVFAVI